MRNRPETWALTLRPPLPRDPLLPYDPSLPRTLLTHAGNYLHIGGVADEDDAVFRALGDPTRRALLDRLRERNGQTLGELCGPLDMARQSATQHLGVLEAANLVTTVRRGREKLHYLNPVPLWEIERRWIGKFERPRLSALSAIKDQAEHQERQERQERQEHEEETMADSTSRPDYVYVTYIESSPERVWQGAGHGRPTPPG